MTPTTRLSEAQEKALRDWMDFAFCYQSADNPCLYGEEPHQTHDEACPREAAAVALEEVTALRVELTRLRDANEGLQRRYDDIVDIDIARQQLPDGTVPGNTVECARGWKRAYDNLFDRWVELRADRDARLTRPEAEALCRQVFETWWPTCDIGYYPQLNQRAQRFLDALKLAFQGSAEPPQTNPGPMLVGVAEKSKDSDMRTQNVNDSARAPENSAPPAPAAPSERPFLEAVTQGPICPADYPDPPHWSCTLAKGHLGDHAAHGLSPTVPIVTWPAAPAAPAVPLSVPTTEQRDSLVMVAEATRQQCADAIRKAGRRSEQGDVIPIDWREAAQIVEATPLGVQPIEVPPPAPAAPSEPPPRCQHCGGNGREPQQTGTGRTSMLTPTCSRCNGTGFKGGWSPPEQASTPGENAPDSHGISTPSIASPALSVPPETPMTEPLRCQCGCESIVWPSPFPPSGPAPERPTRETDAALSVPRGEPTTEQAVIDGCEGHWFIQGGADQFGAITGTHNPDEFVAAVLRVVRTATEEYRVTVERDTLAKARAAVQAQADKMGVTYPGWNQAIEASLAALDALAPAQGEMK